MEMSARWQKLQVPLPPWKHQVNSNRLTRNSVVGAQETSQGSAETKQMSNYEKVMLKAVGNFVVFLHTLADPSLAQLGGSHPMPCSSLRTKGKEWNLFAKFWHYWGLPKGLISVLFDSGLSQEQ